MGMLTHYGAGIILAGIYYLAGVSAYFGNIAGFFLFGITTGLNQSDLQAGDLFLCASQPTTG